MRDGDLLDPAFARRAPQVSPRDRAWVQELVYGTFRLRGRIDDLLARFLRRPLLQLEPDILDILRLGAYQLLEMNSVPAYAAVSQAVEMAVSVSGRSASGLVNGVLQSLRRAQSDLQPDETQDALQFLSTWGAHPRWLVERWLRQFGSAQTRALIDANNQRPALFLRLLGITEEDAVARLRAQDMEAEPLADVPGVLHLKSGDVVRALHSIPAVVQDPAATRVLQFAQFRPDRMVADLCAAPGGKALALSCGNQQSPVFVLAADASYARLQRVQTNAQRLQTHNLALVAADARQPPLREVPQVLLDVPCTGTGTLRRHPDGKWRLQPADLQALVRLQQEILAGVAPCIAPGGLLLYATCSLEPEENEQQVTRFLAQHAQFSLEPPPGPPLPGQDGALLRTLPQLHGFDGAFAARLRRAA